MVRENRKIIYFNRLLHSNKVYNLLAIKVVPITYLVVSLIFLGYSREDHENYVGLL